MKVQKQIMKISSGKMNVIIEKEMKLHSRSTPISAGESIKLSWITPRGLIRKPKIPES